VAGIVLTAAAACAQTALSVSAYRTLGQPDLLQNGLNLVEGFEFNTPSGIAFEAETGV